MDSQRPGVCHLNTLHHTWLRKRRPSHHWWLTSAIHTVLVAAVLAGGARLIGQTRSRRTACGEGQVQSRHSAVQGCVHVRRQLAGRRVSLASLPASTRLWFGFTKSTSAGGARLAAARNKGCSIDTC